MRCECPKALLHDALGQVEAKYRLGLVSQDDLDLYRCAWQTGAPRFEEYRYSHDECMAAVGRNPDGTLIQQEKIA